MCRSEPPNTKISEKNIRIPVMSNQAIVCNINIRQDLYGRYSLNDLHKASGKASKHRPQHWLSNEQTKELIEEISKDGIPALGGNSKDGIPALVNRQDPVVVKHGGTCPGTWACKELVYAYAMWISAKFHLHVIRAFDSMVSVETRTTHKQSTATQLIPLRQKVEQLITTGVGNIYGDIWKLVHNKFEVKTIGQLKPEQIPEAIQYLYEIEGEYISKNQKKTIEIPDFRYQRILLTVENGEVTSTRMVGSDEMLMNRYQYINYFKEPDVGFNDVEQLAELSRTVSERLHKQLGKCR
ncbi:hypothetical protein GRR94_04415 [Vibrio cholerae]|nr:hypothetical protein [Vibrio cholerae]